MTDQKYRITKYPHLQVRPLREPGIFQYWERDGETAGIMSCKCGRRELYLRSHEISYDDDGIVTVHPSIIDREWWDNQDGKTVRGICHFWLKNGEIEMCGDSTCPGACQ
ncbi:MAG: DUF6527 family protein [Rhodobacteraceae bacterium]|nr:DUF6527 family protein [Paracoccaceae bacterium]